MAVSSIHRGFRYDKANDYLEVRYNGTLVGRFKDSAYDLRLTGGNGLTIDSGGATVTAGDITMTAGSLVGLVGNVEIGTPGAFGTTQPQGAVVMGGTSLTGVAPAGAIATAGAVFASDTVVRKIIADGTASNVET